MERVRYADQIPLVYEVASIPENSLRTLKKKKSLVISSRLYKNMAIVSANLNRPSMLDSLRKRLPTIWKLKKDMLFLV